MNKTSTYVVSLICAFGSYYLVQYGFQKYREDNLQSAVGREVDEIRREAELSDSGEPLSTAMQEVATRKVAELINAQGSLLEKRTTAAETFAGFYLINARSRKEFCESLGIDISTFTNEFITSHNEEMAITKELYLKSPGDIDELYKIINPQILGMLEQDMNDLAASINGTPTDACIVMEEYGLEVAKEMHLSIMQPAVFKALHNDK